MTTPLMNERIKGQKTICENLPKENFHLKNKWNEWLTEADRSLKSYVQQLEKTEHSKVSTDEAPPITAVRISHHCWSLWAQTWPPLPRGPTSMSFIGFREYAPHYVEVYRYHLWLPQGDGYRTLFCGRTRPRKPSIYLSPHSRVPSLVVLRNPGNHIGSLRTRRQLRRGHV